MPSFCISSTNPAQESSPWMLYSSSTTSPRSRPRSAAADSTLSLVTVVASKLPYMIAVWRAASGKFSTT